MHFLNGRTLINVCFNRRNTQIHNSCHNNRSGAGNDHYHPCISTRLAYRISLAPICCQSPRVNCFQRPCYQGTALTSFNSQFGCRGLIWLLSAKHLACDETIRLKCEKVDKTHAGGRVGGMLGGVGSNPQLSSGCRLQVILARHANSREIKVAKLWPLKGIPY